MSDKEPNISNDLLAKYFAGEATASESASVERWAAASPENREQLTLMRLLWLDTGAVMMEDTNETSFDVDLAFSNIKAKKQSVFEQRNGKTNRWFLRIAASIVFILALGYILKTYVLDVEQLEYHASAKIGSVELADGSMITLNKGSKLSYPSKFEKGKREVTLIGEAFFEVEHNPEQPFIVYAANTVIEVMGTSFNVSITSGAVEVVVETGKVRFSANNEEVVLSAGQKGLYDETAGVEAVAESGIIPDAAQFWRTRKLSFAGNSLAEVVMSLEEVFEVDIQLENPEMANCSLTVTFENDSLENMLDVIALTLELEVNKSGNTILLSGSGCPSK